MTMYIAGAQGQGLGPLDTSGFRDRDYGYEYPAGLNLHPSSELSKKICKEVFQCAKASYEKMSNRHKSWQSIDRVLTAYVPLDEAEKKVKAKDARKPVSIVVPYAYATLETLLTYLVMSQLRGPIFNYEGRGPEDIIGAILLSKTIEQQVERSKTCLNLHTMFRDSMGYGLGPVVCTWDKQTAKRSVKKDDGFFSFLGNFIKKGNSRSTIETMLYEGNALKNIDPYCYLPDPSVSAHDLQKGEFCGWIERTNLMNLLSQEALSDTTFNVQYLKHCNKKSTLISADASKRNERLKIDQNNENSDVFNPVDVIYMYRKIIPKAWGLGESEYPEKWYFAVAGDQVVIECRPVGLNHNLFPMTVAAPDFDGYSATPVSRIEIIYGLQETLDWLFSSHIANVRKALNDMLIVDPYLVNMKDLETPEPGKLIRLRRAGWGKGVDGAVKQLTVQDVTSSHIADSSYIIELMNRVSASNDSLQGITRKTSERITAAEITGDRTSALNRLERIAYVIQKQAMYDISFMFAAHTQQLMSQETYVKIVGDWPEQLKEMYQPNGRVSVSPFDLLVDFDISMKDVSQDPQNAEIWTNLYGVMAQNPMIAQKFDMVRIFKHIATLMGAKDVNSFVQQGGSIDPKLMTNEQVEVEAAKGNIVPINEFT